MSYWTLFSILEPFTQLGINLLLFLLLSLIYRFYVTIDQFLDFRVFRAFYTIQLSQCFIILFLPLQRTSISVYQFLILSRIGIAQSKTSVGLALSCFVITQFEAHLCKVR